MSVCVGEAGKIKKVRPVRKTRNVGRLNARTLDFFWEKEIERNHMRKKTPGICRAFFSWRNGISFCANNRCTF